MDFETQRDEDLPSAMDWFEAALKQLQNRLHEEWHAATKRQREHQAEHDGQTAAYWAGRADGLRFALSLHKGEVPFDD